MSIRQPPSALASGLAACSVAFLSGCGTTGTGTPTVQVAPMCTIHAVLFQPGSVESALVSERTNPNASHGFTRFRSIAAPQGNSAVGFTPDVYGISEAWSSNSAGSVVYRAQAHPARRRPAGDFEGSAWTIHAQNAGGTWSTPLGTFSANRGNEQDDPAAGALTAPQLMPVGLATPEVFGCAGGRSDDDAIRSTWLIQATAPNAATGTPRNVSFIQDLLSGDDRFVPNAPGILVGPATPPTPRITNRPGAPVREGSVQCAMTQFEDDVSTRELHMLSIRNGVLHHSMANSFGPVVAGSGGSFNRFRVVSPWGDVGQALGGRFGNIVAATVVGRPRAVHVFFVAESGGLHKLWHAVRFSANGGSWRPAEDVLAVIGAAPRGRISPFRVAAGMCPVLDKPQESELVYAMWREDGSDIRIGRMVSTPRQWTANIFGAYSQLFDVSHLMAGFDPTRPTTINSMTIGARPFRDDARASP